MCKKKIYIYNYNMYVKGLLKFIYKPKNKVMTQVINYNIVQYNV